VNEISGAVTWLEKSAGRAQSLYCAVGEADGSLAQ
jgi:hypothetical protein